MSVSWLLWGSVFMFVFFIGIFGVGFFVKLEECVVVILIGCVFSLVCVFVSFWSMVDGVGLYGCIDDKSCGDEEWIVVLGLGCWLFFVWGGLCDSLCFFGEKVLVWGCIWSVC